MIITEWMCVVVIIMQLVSSARFSKMIWRNVPAIYFRLLVLNQKMVGQSQIGIGKGSLR